MRKLLFLLVGWVYLGLAQTPEDIDLLYEEFDSNHPAVAAAVIHQGKIIYQKAYGSIHLDHKIPATIDTKFQLGGLSKHFNAFAIFLLEERGEISLNDDVRKYLPELPEYPEVITIDHLLSQTSGLPDFWTLKNIAGWHRDDVFSQAHAMALIKQMQQSFSPGEDYIYSNTDQVILAEVIRKVSGQSYASFLKHEVFDPLGMVNTLVLEDYEQFIPNVAASYERTADGFKRSALNYGVVGPTNIYSSVSDLAKWELNLINPKVGSPNMAKKLYAQCTRNDGTTLDPLFGRLTYAQQLWHKERGIAKYYQTGTLGGYASSIFKFPESEFTTIVLSSGMNYSGYLGMQTAYLFLEDTFTEPAQIDFVNLKTKKLSPSQLEQFVGTYWNAKSGYSRTIDLKNDTLRYVRTPGSESSILPIGKNKFQMVSFGDERVIITFNDQDEDMIMSLTIGESAPVYSKRIEPFTYETDQLDIYAGTYYCKPLNAVYEFTVKDGQLTAKNLRTGTIALQPIKKGLFESNRWFFGAIQFQESESGVQGFTLFQDEVPALWFNKITS